jgi:acetyl-CoA C-acetyltransferase
VSDSVIFILHARVGIVGIGYEGFRPGISDLSTREIMFEASYKAYNDAGVDPRKDLDSFISCDEDLWEGWSITDEMVPDQLGGAQRPVCTVSGDGIIGIGHAVMQILSGLADVVAVEAHSKAADVISKSEVEMMGVDPTYLRPVGASPFVLAGLEMDMFIRNSRFKREDCSDVVVDMKEKGLKNVRASYAERLSADDVERSTPVSLPLRDLDAAKYIEGSINLVLASEQWIKKNKADPVYIEGLHWCSYDPWYEEGFPSASYMKDSFKGACSQAGLRPSLSEFDVIEVDDTYSYKLLQHIEAMDGAPESVIGDKRLNPSGGSLAVGHMMEATGLQKVLEVVLQIRGEAGGIQLKNVKRGLAASWRGHPTGTGAAVILSR